MLAATALAFAVTERAKLARSPIYATSVTKVFSPDCAVPCTLGSGSAVVSFKLRTRERLTVWIQRGSTRVGTLVSRPGVPARQAAVVRSGRASPAAGTLFSGRDVQALREARALASHDRDPEPDRARHEAAGDHGEAPGRTR